MGFVEKLVNKKIDIFVLTESMDEPRRKHDRVCMNGLAYRVSKGHTIIRLKNGFGFGEGN